MFDDAGVEQQGQSYLGICNLSCLISLGWRQTHMTVDVVSIPLVEQEL
jgi:hypothetical protein